MNKKQCFWLCLGHALLLSAPAFLCTWSGTQVKLHTWKDVFLERNLFNCEAASLISSVFYMLWTIKKRSGSLFRQLWRQNSKTLRVQVFFHLKWDFLWNHFVTKKTIINIFLPIPTYLKCQIDILREKMGMVVAPYCVIYGNNVKYWEFYSSKLPYVFIESEALKTQNFLNSSQATMVSAR